ncbi:MAG: pyridoxal-phosphate dependent enzyme [Xanthomonadales bacterium]|nr:pyridoxal-phosphate dependent enzyme [Xanthomonadales bacterium]
MAQEGGSSFKQSDVQTLLKSSETAALAVLRQICEPVDWRCDAVAGRIRPDWIRQLDATLLSFRQKQGYGRAISAPQIGLSKRLIVLNLGAAPIVMINPEITWHSEQQHWVWDDCLSVPDALVRVRRWVSISVRYQDNQGRWRHWQHLPADMAELVQHEMDHLDGVLMTDHVQQPADRQAIDQREQLLAGQRPPSRLKVNRVPLARQQIPAEFLDTPQYFSDSLSQLFQCRVFCKVESVNPIRSFKGRGASFLLAQLMQVKSLQERSLLEQADSATSNASTTAAAEAKPIVAASAGNWGQALAYECARLGCELIVFAAENANPLKVERMAAMGAKLRLVGADFDAAKAAAKAYAKANALLFVEDGLNEAVSEGHGTIAQELLDLPDAFDAFLAPLGNGALLNGMALWSKANDPAVKMIGVCAAKAPSMHDSWRLDAGSPVVMHTDANTIADGIAVRCPISEAVDDMHGRVDDVLLVDEAHLVEAIKLAQQHLGLLLEPAGAAALAALLAHRDLFVGQTVALVFSGGNLSSEQFQQYFCGGLDSN